MCVGKSAWIEKVVTGCWLNGRYDPCGNMGGPERKQLTVDGTTVMVEFYEGIDTHFTAMLDLYVQGSINE